MIRMGGKSIKVPYESKSNIWSLTIAWSLSDSLLPLLHEMEEPHKGRIFQFLNLENKLPNFSVGKLKSPTNIEGWEEWLFNQWQNFNSSSTSMKAMATMRYVHITNRTFSEIPKIKSIQRNNILISVVFKRGLTRIMKPYIKSSFTWNFIISFLEEMFIVFLMILDMNIYC